MPAPQHHFSRLSREPRALLTAQGTRLGTVCVLDEVQGLPGLRLWQILQDVQLWASTPPAERGGLFSDSPGSVAIPGLEVLLSTLTSKLRQECTPDDGTEAFVVHACKEVVGWAERAGYVSTAVEFAQTAAVVSPRDASVAYLAGRLLRIRGEYPRAELWYRRAVVLGRKSGDWESHANALGGLGAVYEQYGNLKIAHHFYLRCFRAAREHALPELKGRVLHALCVLAFDLGTPEEVAALGTRALRTLGRNHPHVPKLANDLVWYWLARRGAQADTLIRSLVNQVWEPASRLQVLANFARSAGAAQDSGAYLQAVDEARTLLTFFPNGEGHAQALRDLAHGALALGRWDQAAEMVGEAVRIATARREGYLKSSLDDILQATKAQRGTPVMLVALAPSEEVLAAALTSALA